MKIEDEESGKTYKVQIVLPFDVRVFAWAIWHISLGICLGVAIHNLAVVSSRLH